MKPLLPSASSYDPSRLVSVLGPKPGSLVQCGTSGFDGIPPHMVYKLSKKQEETTRSLEKIEKGKLAMDKSPLQSLIRPESLLRPPP